MKTGQNKIPRNFARIVLELVKETSNGSPGDVLHIYRNDHGLLALNTRTGEYAYIFPEMLRNPGFVKITNIERNEEK